MRSTLLLLQVAKLPIFRADRRFVGGVSNSNYVANGAPGGETPVDFRQSLSSRTTLLVPGLCDDDVETSHGSR